MVGDPCLQATALSLFRSSVSMLNGKCREAKPVLRRKSRPACCIFSDKAATFMEVKHNLIHV